MKYLTSKAKMLGIFGKFFEQTPNLTKDVVVTDDSVYFVSVRCSVGLFGWRMSSKHKPVRLNRSTSSYFMDQDIAYLSDLRRSEEGTFFIGTRDYIMGKLSFVTHDDFDEADTVECLRAKDSNRFIESLIKDIPHPTHVFTTWLRAQIECGLHELNGIVLVDYERTALSTNSLSKQPAKIVKHKECEPEEYLKRYQDVLKRHYDAKPLTLELEQAGGFVLPTLDELARDLLKQQVSSYLGLSLAMEQNDIAKLAKEVHSRNRGEKADVRPLHSVALVNS